MPRDLANVQSIYRPSGKPKDQPIEEYVLFELNRLSTAYESKFRELEQKVKDITPP